MAKRKRLTPAQSGFLGGEGAAAPRRAPIAQVAGDASATAALAEVSNTLQKAREDGRLVLSLPLAAIVPDHLVRDRSHLDEDAQTALKQSLMARGQQMPIEVLALEEEGRYGLISGWRRFAALKALSEETGEARFGQVLCLLRQPDDLAQSYVAMVEENEIRADLSFFERARIVLRALEAGVFETEKAALQGLFANASYSRRSKIKSFVPIVAGLEGALRFPAHLSERAGLALAKALEADPDLAGRLRVALQATPAETPEAEAALIARVQRPEAEPAKSAPLQVELSVKKGRIVLSGADVDEALAERLRAWLARGR